MGPAGPPRGTVLLFHQARSNRGEYATIAPDLPSEMIHFACTSEDINNLAYALILKEFVRTELAPALAAVEDSLSSLARRHRATPMLSRTHGQAATPTTVGKEFAVA